MKLNAKDIELQGEHYRQKEPMKHRFKEKWVMFPTTKDELIWEEVISERGMSKKRVREINAKARKPYWRKKRKEQTKYKKNQQAQYLRDFSHNKPLLI